MKNEKGFSLVEVLVALALLGIIGAAFLGSLATASKSILIADERTTAESLARTEMEYVKNQSYAASYEPSIPDEYTDAGYWATIDVELLPDPNDGTLDGIQKIIITVKHGTEAETAKEVITLEDYKVDR